MHNNPILRISTKILFAPIILFGLYVQFHGDFGPGGGVQAGVIVASAFILYSLVFGNKEGKANYENFQLHLSTIFTEVRLKKYIELRSIDACEWDCHCAGPAFFIGLLYGNLNETFEIIKNWNKEDILKAYTTSYKDGLKTIINNKDLLFWSKELLNISKRGLENRSFVTTKNNDERIYLKNIENILSKNLTKAEQVLLDLQK